MNRVEVKRLIDMRGLDEDMLHGLDHALTIMEDCKDLEEARDKIWYAIRLLTWRPDKEMEESCRPRGRMLREGLLSQAKEEAEKKKNNGKIIQERARKFLKVLHELFLHAGYQFEPSEAEWTLDNELRIPYNNDDEKTEKLVTELCKYGWISKWNKAKIWVKAYRFADDDDFESLMDWLS